MGAWFTGVVVDNADEDKRGRLQLQIDAIHDGEPLPDWIEHDSGGGPALAWIPVKDAIVRVYQSDGGGLRWVGGPMQGAQVWPAPLRKDYPERGGIASPDGASCVVLLNAGGAMILAGAGGTILISTSEDAIVEPVVLGDKLDTYLAGGLVAALLTFAGACTAAAVEPALAPAATILQTALNALPATSSWKSTVASVE